MVYEMREHLKKSRVFSYCQEIHLIELNFAESPSDREEILNVTNVCKHRHIACMK